MTSTLDLGQAHKTCGGVKLVLLDPNPCVSFVNCLVKTKCILDESVEGKIIYCLKCI